MGVGVSYERGTPVRLSASFVVTSSDTGMDTFPMVSYHTVDYDSFNDSPPASRNQLWALLWCKLGHVTFEISGGRNPRSAPCDS